MHSQHSEILRIEKRDIRTENRDVADNQITDLAINLKKEINALIDKFGEDIINIVVSQKDIRLSDSGNECGQDKFKAHLELHREDAVNWITDIVDDHVCVAGDEDIEADLWGL